MFPDFPRKNEKIMEFSSQSVMNPVLKTSCLLTLTKYSPSQNYDIKKVIRNTSYFILKAVFVLKIFKFLSWLFEHLEKMAIRLRLDEANFKIHHATTWLTNNYNTYVTQYLTKWRQPDNEIWSVNRTRYFSSRMTQTISQT